MVPVGPPSFFCSQHVRYRCFDDWDSAATFLRTEQGCDLCGIVLQSRNTSTVVSPPPQGAAPRKKIGSCGVAAAVTASDQFRGEKENSGAGSTSSATTNREAGNMPAVEGPTTGTSSEICEESSSSPSLLSPEGCLQEENESQTGGDSKGRTLPSTPVRRRPFRKSTAFLVGHRNRLEDEALDVCDFLVHVEQVGECWHTQQSAGQEIEMFFPIKNADG